MEIEICPTTSIVYITHQRETMKSLDVTCVSWIIWSFAVLGFGAPFPDKNVSDAYNDAESDVSAGLFEHSERFTSNDGNRIFNTTVENSGIQDGAYTENRTDRESEEEVMVAIQNNGVPLPFCQESLGLTNGVFTSAVATLTTSEGVADDVKLHSASMWSVSANSSDAWIKVTFETEVLVTAFMVRHDAKHGQRLAHFQVAWAEDCTALDNNNNAGRYNTEEFTVAFDEHSKAPGIITVQVVDPIQTKCLMISPYVSEDSDEPLAVQMDLLGCGTFECSKHIDANIITENGGLTVNFKSEKLVTEVTYYLSGGYFEHDVNDSLHVTYSRTCRTFHNTIVKQISIHDSQDKATEDMHQILSLVFPSPIRLQCLFINTSEIVSLSKLSGTASALGCDIWREVAPGCGRSTFPHNRPKRVAGGYPISMGQWPWLVSLKFSEFHPFRNFSDHYFSHLCGGSLIHPNWVLSAAHCVSNTTYEGLDDATNWSAALGEHTLLENEETTEIYEVEKIIPHTVFWSRKPISHDICLIKLKEPVPLSSYARTVCLDEVGAGVKDHCMITGWGGIQEENRTGANNVPMQANIPIISTEMCWHRYYNISDSHPAKGFAIIDDGVLCAAAEEGGRDTCAGDSGGPILCLHETTWHLAGISSGGYHCGQYEFPGVYTRISHYLDWIKTTIEKN